MGRMVIEVPEELTELGKAMAEQLAEVQRTMARQGGGKAVDYALVEQAVCEAAGRTEREAHRAILQSLDIDVPAVVIGKERYTRVGGARTSITRWRVRCRWSGRCTASRESGEGSLGAKWWMR